MITDYAALQTEIADELNRQDLVAKIPLWIQLAEAEMIRDLQVGTGQEINVDYRAAITPLSATNTTNWLLDAHPDCYFYATLKHSAPYLDDDQRLSVWIGLYSQAKKSINSDARKYSIDSEPQTLHVYNTQESER